MRGSRQGGGVIPAPAVIGFFLFIIIMSLAAPPSGADTADRHHISSNVALRPAPQTATWFLEAMRRLLHEGRAGESYQLAQLAVARFPHSPDLRLGAAYAAVASGRCRLAVRHLAHLHTGAASTGLTHHHHRQHDMLRAQCRGPWSRRLVIQVTTGYRPSLSDRARRFDMTLEPGSRLHGLCVRLADLCDPDRRFVGGGVRDSGIDMWMQFRLEHRYRAGTAWDADISPVIFRRQPSRPGHVGQGAMLRAEGWRHLSAGRHLHLLAETGVAAFGQGDPALAFTQSHRRVRAALAIRHKANLMSQVGHGRTWAHSRWLDLRQRRYDYRLHLRPDELHSAWLGLASERSSQSGTGLLAGSRGRLLSFGGHRDLPLATVSLWQEQRRQNFTRALSYLAAPHRANTRTTGLDLIPVLPKGLNLKVVVSFSYRKISSPDISRPRTTKTLMFTLRYIIGDTV